MRKTLLIMAVAIGVAIAFGTIANAAPKAEFGIVKVSDANSAAELQMDKTTKVVVTAKGIKFPVGTYTPLNMTVMRQDKSGTVWSIEADVSPFTVTRGETTTITVPTKVNVKPTFGAVATTSAGRALPIGVSFSAAETGVGSEIRMGSARVPAPQFQITDSKGRLLQAGSFSYG